MKKKLLSLALALVMCLGLLPSAASVAESLPDWYFLFAIFKNVDADGKDKTGKATHIKYSMTQTEIDYFKEGAQGFEEYMNSLGVMRAHVDVVEIDETVTELKESTYGAYLNSALAEPFLKGKADLNKYDHVFCDISLSDNINLTYTGLTGTSFENGTGQTCMRVWDWDYIRGLRPFRESIFPSGQYVHEFLHFASSLNNKWGEAYDLHKVGDTYNTGHVDNWKGCYTDIILNRATGGYGTGVAPVVWQYPPHVLRTVTELTIPSRVTSIGDRAFWGVTDHFTRVFIPTSVTSIGYAAFWDTGIEDVYYEGTEKQWKAIKIGDYNDPLTKAKIHYNSANVSGQTTPPTNPTNPAAAVNFTDVKKTDWFYTPVEWAVGKGITSGTSKMAFSPNQTCTQGQILTFLWRAKGEPKPAGAVSGTQYYAAAVQWAKEQGLVSGTISPNAGCSRADVVTYLWKLAGSPSAKAASFTDVSASASYAKAVDWAVEQGVTAGISDTQFGPDMVCTRGQIVTFLYSALAK